MRIGICASYEKAEFIKDCGFDYLEYNLVSLQSLSQEEFMQAQRLLERLDFYAEVMGIMLPPSLKVVGNQVNREAITGYLINVLERAELFGCKKVVFGSSHSRNMPKDFSNRALAYKQIASFLTEAAEMLDRRGMSLVIEPCPIHENSILTLIPEAYYVMRMVKLPNVRIMADTYTMQFAYERLDEIAVYKDVMEHLHFSAPNRTIPCPWDNHDYNEFFKLLRKIRYDRTLTIEAFHYDDFCDRCKGAYRLLVNGLGDLINHKEE
ncbi:MAG: sugar phosphate isomerase/epimerase [Clostridia bacterium]|nr:sugar phosphate isomerase/epimerase [Clostridia bacterium]